MDTNENRPASKAPYVVGGILGIAVLGGLVAWALGSRVAPATEPADADNGNATSTDDAQQPATTSAQTPEQPAPAPASTYKDGTYSATGHYVSPAGPESVEVSVTLKDDQIVNATFKGDGVNPTTIQMQTRFAQGYRAQVVGKDLDAVALTVVNGSSLAPKGFMDALAQIKAEAQA